MNDETVARGEDSKQAEYMIEISIWEPGELVGRWVPLFNRVISPETARQIKALAVKP